MNAPWRQQSIEVRAAKPGAITRIHRAGGVVAVQPSDADQRPASDIPTEATTPTDRVAGQDSVMVDTMRRIHSSFEACQQ